MISRTILAIVISVMVALPGVAQKKKQVPPSQEEMTKRWRDFMTPGESHKVLNQFVGSWETESNIWMAGPGKPPTTTKGTAEVKWVLGGRFVQQELTGQMMDMPWNGIGFTGYDNFKKKYTSFWIDNSTTAMATSEGTINKEGTIITSWGKMDQPMTGEKDKKVKYIETITNHDKHIFEIHDLSLPDPDNKVVEIVYTRKK